jgi:oligopeptide/dipeptide ABC transporter ATP-binding protein
MTRPILSLEHVAVDFHLEDDIVSAVADVSLSVQPREIVGIVGESGCGKSTLAMATMGLLGSQANVTGRIVFEDRDLVALAEKERRRLRGDRMAMIFQDPLTSLDPTYGVGEQVAEAIRAHRDVTKAQAKERAVALLRDVGIPAAERRYDDPPHKLSGGMRQRVVVAAALANDPPLLIADEPSTALDVTIQAQILELLLLMRERHDTAIMLITHDLGVVAQVCDRVAVMYAGQLVETAPTVELFRAPRHPYTQALLAAQPTSGLERGRLRVIDGEVADLTDPPPGCRFAPRCPLAYDACAETPAMRVAGPDHQVACWAADPPAVVQGTARATVAIGSAADDGPSEVTA